MLISSKARISLVKRFKETQTEEEHRNLVYLFKYNDRLKKSKRRYKKEIESFNVDLKELLEKHEPNISSR